MVKKSIGSFAVFLLLLYSPVAYAHPSSGQWGSESAGWLYRGGHLSFYITDWRYSIEASNYPNIRTGFENAAKAWNSKQNKVIMGRVESRSDQIVHVENFYTNYSGMFYEQGTKVSNGHHTYWKISINIHNYSMYPAYHFQKVAAHEIGHIWGLGDLTSSQWNGVATMYGATPSTAEPGTTDVNGITKIW